MSSSSAKTYNIIGGSATGLGRMFQGQAQYDTFKSEAENINNSKEEVKKRAAVNTKARERQGSIERAGVDVTAASSGVSLDTMAAYHDYSHLIELEELDMIAIESDWEIARLTAEQEAAEQNAKDQKTANILNTVGTIASIAGMA